MVGSNMKLINYMRPAMAVLPEVERPQRMVRIFVLSN